MHRPVLLGGGHVPASRPVRWRRFAQYRESGFAVLSEPRLSRLPVAVASVRSDTRHETTRRRVAQSMTRTFWLSFVDETRPEGDRFLGVCVVDVTDEDAARAKEFQARRFPGALPGAEWLGAAIRKSHAIGCNPGGNAAGLDITNTTLPIPIKNKLLSFEELEAFATRGDIDAERG